MEPGYTTITKEVGIELKDGTLGENVRVTYLVVTSTSSFLAGKEDNGMQGGSGRIRWGATCGSGIAYRSYRVLYQRNPW